jgi:hypothetical protein
MAAKKLSPSSIPRGGKSAISRSNSARICSRARRAVAVEQTIFGCAQHTVDLAGREEVDRGLVEADHRAERAGDQVELVLDDELGREQAGCGSGRALFGGACITP